MTEEHLDEVAGLLAEHGFFADLGADDLRTVAACGELVHFEAHEVIFRDGEPARVLFAITAGTVALETHVPDRGAITIATLGADDVLGASWIVAPFRVQFDAVAVEPVRAVALDVAALQARCDHDPRLGYDLVRRFAGVLLQRLQATRVRLLDLYGEAGA